MEKNKALFLDRDGVVCKALDGYLLTLKELELLPGIHGLLEKAEERGYLSIIVTNQPQIEKGLLTERDLKLIHQRLLKLLNHKIHKIYFCPHTNAGQCLCRKPRSGMLEQAARELNIDLKKSLIVGDSWVDMAAGKEAGCKTIFIKNEFKENEVSLCSPNVIVDTLSEIVAIL